MAYGNRKKGGTVGGSMGDAIILAGKTMIDIIGSGGTRGPNGSETANIALAVQTPDGDYACASSKVYTEKSSIIQKISGGTSSSVEGFVTISSFSKTLGALTVHNAKAIVIKNRSHVATELMIGLYDWRDDSGGTDTDVANSVDMNEENSTGEETTIRFISMLLPANDFIYLPNSRFLSYSPLASTTTESAANSGPGAVAIEPKDINSGNEYVDIHLFAGQTYFSGADVQLTEDVALAELEIDVDDGDWFKANDLIMIGSEVMQIESIATNTLTVSRGLLGSTEAAHSDDDDLKFFFGNEHLAFNNGKCMTDQNGNFSQRGAFFGYGRTADKKIDGLVAGSVAIGPFFTKGGYLDWGLQNIKPSDNTGLAVSTTYTFHIVVDEYSSNGVDGLAAAPNGEVAIAFTTDSSDVTFNGSGNAVIPKIQARFDALFYDESVGLFNKKVRISLHNGDIRVSSLSNHSETRIGIANVSGTTPFGVGRFPALSSSVPVLKGSPHGGGTTDTMVFGPASSLELEEIDDRVSGKTIKNTSAFLIDDGLGNLRHNGNIAGIVDYISGHVSFSYLPNSEFKIYAKTLSAHAGGVKHLANTYNSIKSIEARSINTKQDSEIELILLG